MEKFIVTPKEDIINAFSLTGQKSYDKFFVRETNANPSPIKKRCIA